MTDKPMLYIFGGLPGTGKSTLSKALSKRIAGVYLRIDTIEQTILQGSKSVSAGPEGYNVAAALARDNLKCGLSVIIDAVNSTQITRDLYKSVALNVGVDYCQIEIGCTCKQEHRRRIETRKVDIAGHLLPTWEDVGNINYEPWRDVNISIDTANQTFDESLTILVNSISSNFLRA